MKKALWVDDIRNPPPDLPCDVARNYAAAIALLEAHVYDIAYLDHDLADIDKNGREKTGYDVLMYIVQMKIDGRAVPSEYNLLTANPVGAERMQGVVKSYLTQMPSEQI